MKIRCPACAKALNVPDAARGKAVKCPCGNQIKIPAGGARQSASDARPSAAPARAANEDLFDELTESDLRTARPPEQVQQEDVEDYSQPETQSGSKLKLALYVFLVLLVLGGIGGAVYYFFFQ